MKQKNPLLVPWDAAPIASIGVFDETKTQMPPGLQQPGRRVYHIAVEVVTANDVCIEDLNHQIRYLNGAVQCVDWVGQYEIRLVRESCSAHYEETYQLTQIPESMVWGPFSFMPPGIPYQVLVYEPRNFAINGDRWDTSPPQSTGLWTVYSWDKHAPPVADSAQECSGSQS